MSPEIDLLNTYPVCGRERHADSHSLLRLIRRRDCRPIAADTDTGPASVIRSSGSGRTETPDSPDRDAVATQR
jgi:hypothetical protein